jgi:hypothetical protein
MRFATLVVVRAVARPIREIEPHGSQGLWQERELAPAHNHQARPLGSAPGEEVEQDVGREAVAPTPRPVNPRRRRPLVRGGRAHMSCDS